MNEVISGAIILFVAGLYVAALSYHIAKILYSLFFN